MNSILKSVVHRADTATRAAVTGALSRELALGADVSFAFAYGSFVSRDAFAP